MEEDSDSENDPKYEGGKDGYKYDEDVNRKDCIWETTAAERKRE